MCFIRFQVFCRERNFVDRNFKKLPAIEFHFKEKIAGAFDHRETTNFPLSGALDRSRRAPFPTIQNSRLDRENQAYIYIDCGITLRDLTHRHPSGLLQELSS